MRFSNTIDLYVDDMASQGRLNSPRSVASYRRALSVFADDVDQRDPRFIGREDIRRTLRRYPHPNTQRRQLSMFRSFFDWMMEEGHGDGPDGGRRKDNPARQVRSPKARDPKVNRLTLEEVRRFLGAARTLRERRIAYLGVFAGLRRNELRLLQGRHFERGYLDVDASIAKGGHERVVPFLADLQPLVDDIRATVQANEFVVPAQSVKDVPASYWSPKGYVELDDPLVPADGKSIWRATRRIGRRAGIKVEVGPHMMRRAFADYITAAVDMRTAQLLLGHKDISTTQLYLSKPRAEDLAELLEGVTLWGDGLSPPPDPAEGEQWRRWESNPRLRPPAGVDVEGRTPFGLTLERLFASTALREAARGL